MSAAIGFIAGSGTTGLNGVVMIPCFKRLRKNGRSARRAVAVLGNLISASGLALFVLPAISRLGEDRPASP